MATAFWHDDFVRDISASFNGVLFAASPRVFPKSEWRNAPVKMLLPATLVVQLAGLQELYDAPSA